MNIIVAAPSNDNQTDLREPPYKALSAIPASQSFCKYISQQHPFYFALVTH